MQRSLCYYLYILDGCLQPTLDMWCENLGTDDNFEVESEDTDCNNQRFARFDGSIWHCFTDLTDELDLACISDNEEMIECNTGDKSNGKYCTRDQTISQWIEDGCLQTTDPLPPTTGE